VATEGKIRAQRCGAQKVSATPLLGDKLCPLVIFFANFLGQKLLLL